MANEVVEAFKADMRLDGHGMSLASAETKATWTLEHYQELAARQKMWAEITAEKPKPVAAPATRSSAWKSILVPSVWNEEVRTRNKPEESYCHGNEQVTTRGLLRATQQNKITIFTANRRHRQNDIIERRDKSAIWV